MLIEEEEEEEEEVEEEEEEEEEYNDSCLWDLQVKDLWKYYVYCANIYCTSCGDVNNPVVLGAGITRTE